MLSYSLLPLLITSLKNIRTINLTLYGKHIFDIISQKKLPSYVKHKKVINFLLSLFLVFLGHQSLFHDT
nr:MAG TPA: hypothetical protein [Caudoviricetes sp.]